MEEILKEKGKEVLCIFSQTSAFAPRVPDDVESIAKLCKKYNVHHLINNAFGLACTRICHKINMAEKNGVVDFVVQSTDKNYMTPVGGAIVFSSNKKLMTDFA